MVGRPLALEKGGRRIRADGSPEATNQLAHAVVRIALFFSGVVLREALDKEGAQCLVLAVGDGGIGLQEKVSTTDNIHG
jgi:hypothetical protein